MPENKDYESDLPTKFENIDMLIKEDYQNVTNPNTLISYLRLIDKSYEKNLEDQHFFEKTRSVLNEELSLVEKKIQTFEKAITQKKKEQDNNINILNNKKKTHRTSFFDILQQDNEKEVILKKNNVLSEEIKNLELSKKKSENSKHNLCDFKRLDFDKKKSELITVIKKIVLCLQDLNLEDISENDYQIIYKSIKRTDLTFPEYRINQSKKYRDHILIYFGLSIPIVVISCMVYYFK